MEGQLGGADFLTALPANGWDKDKVVEEVLVSKMLSIVNEEILVHNNSRILRFII